ncbi:MAG: DUF6512 family protein [Hespellia sp.]|nr:DUF6512 family protein [Hespellia sp.]
MKKNLKSLFIIGAVLISILGTLGHFLYEWTGNNPIVAYFSAVNESTWEHLKLLFFPLLLWTVVSYFLWGREKKCYWGANACGCLAGLLTIVTLYYTYRGALGFNIDFLNIAIYFVSVVVSCYIAYCCIVREKCCWNDMAGILFFIIMTILFWIFTAFPPQIALFQSPI